MSWLHVEMTLLDLARGSVAFALTWLLQSTLLVGAGLAIARLLSRRGSATQSVIYRTTLAAVLVCPPLTWAISLTGVSGWSLNMPPAWTQPQAERLTATTDNVPPQVASAVSLPSHLLDDS